MSSVSLAALHERGVTLRPHEAVAIAQSLIHRPEASASVARPPYGPPTPDTVEVASDGSVVCTCSAATPAVSEVAILLHGLLPLEKTRAPGGLVYAIGRALLEVEAPPFDSVDDFSRALSRFERGDREEVVRGLVERSLDSSGAASHSGAPIRLEARHLERRRAGPGVDELRRQLREADRQCYEALVASEHRVAPPVVVWRAPAVLGVAVAALIALISVGQLISHRRPASSSGPATSGLAAERSTATTRPIAAVHAPARAGAAPEVVNPPIGAAAASVRRPATSRARQVSERTDRTLASDDLDVLVPALDAQHRPVFSPAFASNGTATFFPAGRGPDARSARMAVDITSPDLRVVSIVDDGARNYHVQPSPDERLIAFDSDRDGERGVYIANRDGSQVRRVSGPGYAAVPTWAPDSKRIAFVRAEQTDPKVWNLWLLSTGSGELRQLTRYRRGQTWSASWFPDGERLCYTHEDKLVLLDLANTEVRQFDSPIARRLVRMPAVSPDGSKIVFQVYRDGVWLLDVRDGSMRSLFRDPSAEEFAWAPDGRRVAFHSRRDGQWGIYLLAAGS